MNTVNNVVRISIWKILESKSTLSSWNKAYERIIIGKEKDSNHNQNPNSKHSSEILKKFEGKSRDVSIILNLLMEIYSEHVYWKKKND